MRRRDFLKYSAATTLAGSIGYRAARAEAPSVKVGVVGAKTGPLAPGAAITHFPPFRLWAHEVNERGGLKLKNGQRKVEIIEYDDRTQPPEAIKAVERLATVDKADWIASVYATGFNLATRQPSTNTNTRRSLSLASPIRRLLWSRSIPISSCSTRRRQTTPRARSACSKT